MYKRRVRGWSQHIDFMFLDNLCAFSSLLIAFLIVEKEGVLNSRVFWWMVLETMLVNTVVMIVLDTYHSVLHHSPWDEMLRLLSQTGYLVLILLVFQLLNQTTVGNPNMSRIVLNALILYLLSCYIMRQVYKTFLKKKHHIYNRHSMLIALEASQIPTVIPRILRSNYGIYRFTGLAIMANNPSDDEVRVALNMIRDE